MHGKEKVYGSISAAVRDMTRYAETMLAPSLASTFGSDFTDIKEAA